MESPARTLEFQLRDVVFSDQEPLASSADAGSLRGDALFEEVDRLQDAPRARWALTAVLFGRARDATSVCVVVSGFRPELYYDASVPDEHIRAAANHRGKIRIEVVQRYDAGDCRLDEDGKKLPSTYKRADYSLASAYKRACYCDDPRPHHTIPKLESKFFVHAGLVPEGWVALNLAAARRRGPHAIKKECISWADHEYEASMGDLAHVDRAEFAPLVMCGLDIEAVSDAQEFPNPIRPRDHVCSVSVVTWTNGSPLDVASRRYCVCLRETSPVPGATILSCKTERELFLRLRDLMLKLGPDVILTWNGCGFDWRYIYERSKLVHCEAFAYLSCLRFHACTFETKKMKSGARGDQELEFFAMPGRTNLDLMQWYMANYKKDTYALNAVAVDHTGEKKLDFDYKLIHPYFHGTPDQRGEMAAYCIQDSELLRVLCEKLKTVGDQIELSRVCCVIMERLTTHGQGLKVVSQMNLKCVNMRAEGYEFDFILDNHNVSTRAERVAREAAADDDDGYEGATVVDPKKGYYKNKVIIVMDFSSLYPSIMIGDNLCKSTLVRRPEDYGKPGVVAYDIGASGRAWRATLVVPDGYDVVECPRLTHMLGMGFKLAEKDWKSLAFQSLKMRTAVPNTGAGGGYFVPTDGNVYHFTSTNKGIMPAMLDETLARRKLAKKEKERAEAQHDRLVALEQQGTPEARLLRDQILAYEKRQLALKVSANSAYGFLGAERTGAYPDKSVAATVTACGRDMLMDSCDVCREVAQTLGRQSDGQPVGDLDLVYGDTDSLMVTLEEVDDPVDGYYAGVAMSNEVTRRFHAKGHKSKKLEMEKCFFPWILFSKKKYCGILWEMGHEGKVVSRGAKHSGTANKRRDSCKYVHKAYDAMVHPLLHELDDAKCIAQFHAHMRALVDGKAPFEDMVITKSLQSTYKNENLAQCKVVAKQREREPGSETKPGGRLRMVFCKGARDAKINDLAEDADYAKAQGLPLDLCVYVKSQMWTPLQSLLEQVHSNPHALLQFYLDEAKRRNAGVPSFSEFAKNLPMRRKAADAAPGPSAADARGEASAAPDAPVDVADHGSCGGASDVERPVPALNATMAEAKRKKKTGASFSESITKWMKKGDAER